MAYTSLKNTENEIQEFESLKQRKLNELQVLVPLRFHQLQFLENNSVPKDLASALVFSNSGLDRLKNRMAELQSEKIEIEKQHKELKRHHVNYVKNRKEKQLHLLDLEGRSKDLQMLKFGRCVDLDKLEKIGVNKVADELREKARQEELRNSVEIERMTVYMHLILEAAEYPKE